MIKIVLQITLTDEGSELFRFSQEEYGDGRIQALQYVMNVLGHQGSVLFVDFVEDGFRMNSREELKSRMDSLRGELEALCFDSFKYADKYIEWRVARDAWLAGEVSEWLLSGEWAGGLTPDSVVAFVAAKGFPAPEDDLEFGEWVQELCDAFEEGYCA